MSPDRVACLLGSLIALAGAPAAPAQQNDAPASKPAAKPVKGGRPLPALFAPRAAPPGSTPGPAAGRGASTLSEAAVGAGLDWLRRHQETDGSWSCEKFRGRCQTEGFKCGGKGMPLYDVGVSALALLAFLGAGDSEQEGRHADVVKNGIAWLRSQQDAKGTFGTTEDYRYPFVHAMATLAMVENAALSGSTQARASAQRALDFLMAIRSPKQRAWRYAEKPPDSDATVTAWAVLALKAGQVAGIRNNDQGLRGASEFIRKITDDRTGRTGYLVKGDAPFRFEAQQRKFPPQESESLTACGMTVRIFCGEEPRGSGLLRSQARLLLDRLPEWNPDSGRIDLFYWHFGTIALAQLGGDEWARWYAAVKDAMLSGQQKGEPGEDCRRGSWDPIDPWGTQGGRVYATAMAVLCLEGPYRFGPLFHQ
jgi:hypothetical protein